MIKDIEAALIFFTRLPFWRLFTVSSENFKQTINYWSVAGWVTASVMAAVLWLSAHVLPLSVAVLLAVAARVLITGALHEDGLADFFDGFGGGVDKERILAIMKDSHIGTYGVLGLIFYFLMLWSLLSVLPVATTCLLILAADPCCKFISSLITFFLPYARTEETSKSKTVYSQMRVPQLTLSAIFGLLPLLLFLPPTWWVLILFPIIVFAGLVYFMKRKIQGYTGDCCGALFLLCELSFYLGGILLALNTSL